MSAAKLHNLSLLISDVINNRPLTIKLKPDIYNMSGFFYLRFFFLKRAALRAELTFCSTGVLEIKRDSF